MARQLRLEYPDAYYHVMNRGAGHKRVFHDETFYDLFIELLAEITQRFKVEIHAYCLMGNHYHLLLKTRYKNLSRSMRHLNSVYTMRHHRLTGKDGALFRGRFKSILVDSENYLLQVSRYIHLNPTEAGLVRTPESYPWSSCKAYYGVNARPAWLTVNETLSRFSGKQKEQYKEFVNEGIDEEIQKIYESSRKVPIIGSETFCKELTKIFSITPKVDVTSTKTLSSRYVDKSQIIKKLSSIYHVCEQDILSGKNKMLRKVAVYFCCKLAKDTQAELGQYFSNIGYSAISQINRRFNAEMRKSGVLKEEIARIENILSNVKT